MSFVRWSDESDVYVFADVRGGWTTMLTGSAGGDVYRDATRKPCRDRLLLLREMGYLVPQHPIDRLNREMMEEGQP